MRKSTPRKITESMARGIVDAYKSGVEIPVIAEMFLISKSGVNKTLNRQKVPRNRPLGAKRTPPENLLAVRVCKKCGERKGMLEFYERPHGKRNHSCKQCMLKNGIDRIKKTGYQLKKLYGISAEDYEHMLAAQNYSCAICKRSRDLFKKRFAVDHCHSTGKVRALLCIDCNTSLGGFQESSEMLRRAADYLDAHAIKNTGSMV